MKKNPVKIAFLTLFLAILPSALSAETSKIVFTSEPQSILPGEPSGAIIIQSQNSNGEQEAIGETSDVFVESSSPSGEFSSSQSNWQKSDKFTMNSNWANRTFYYRDSSSGTFTILVRVVKRTGGEEFGASQEITVSLGESQSPASGSAQSGSSSSSQSSGTGTSRIVSSQGSQLEVLAGSDRVTSAGSPLWFQAFIKKNTSQTDPELNWSFGDGNVGSGSLVSHSYKYSGEYVVVLSAKSGNSYSVSRLKVKVIEPQISVSDEGNCLKISNKSNAETNLFNWRIESGGKAFIFQPDTIILPGASVRIDKSLLKMKDLGYSLGISLKNPNKEEVFSVVPKKEIDLEKTKKELSEIKEEFSKIQQKAKELGINTAPKSRLAGAATQYAKAETEKKQEVLGEATSTEEIIYEASKNPGILGRTWQFIKGVLR